MSSPYQSVYDLTDISVRRLVRYLYLPTEYSIAKPPKHWLKEQEETMNKLPVDCLRPRGKFNVVSIVTRGLMRFSEKYNPSFTPQAAVLCPSHHGLNPWTIHALFALVLKEITVDTDRLRLDRQRGKGPEFGPSIQEFLRRLDDMQALWMDTYTFELLYGRQPKVLSGVRSKCEACILSALGSRPLFLGDLRAHCIARTEGMTPCLQRVVDAWINEFPEPRRTELCKRSAFLAEEIRTMLKDIRIARHERRAASRQRRAKASAITSRDTKTKSGSDSPRFITGGQSTTNERTLMPISEDPFADPYDGNADSENRPWQDAVVGYYERLAVANGKGGAFDRSSIHPTFGDPAPQPDPQFRRDFGDNSVYARLTSLRQCSKTKPDAVIGFDMPVTPTAALDTQPYNQYSNEAPSSPLYTDVSVYSNDELARPHPPVSAPPSVVTTWPQQRSSPSSGRPRPGGIVSSSSVLPQNNNVMTQDGTRAEDLPPGGLSLSPTEAEWYLGEAKRVAYLEEMGRIGRPSFKDHISGSAASGSEAGSRTPTGSARPGPSSPASWTVPTVLPLDDDDVRSIVSAPGQAPMSEVSTIYPDDSMSFINFRRW
ncbi:hypothetical protein CORC01_05961 [Colletotrichum orchidophilum]|uniref:Uncharacterized protein n=1 Tax=Colletotrichum orchidophilum TaxID=1209926 RepID=A0A1G4BBH5_9PEZI|nr:uncharacterized protein CORC01_05961 [Colletotrichum orchidophilum]OHE98695.1 hypothetical protein CORC01_05961 [Colletotrichum orchidophilum]